MLATSLRIHANKTDPAKNMDDVTNTDLSAVGRLANNPSIKLDNEVYIGVDGDKLCELSKHSKR